MMNQQQQQQNGMNNMNNNNNLGANGPANIGKKYLNQFAAATYCMCCESWTLLCGVNFMTLLGVVFGVMGIVAGIVLVALGFWPAIFIIIISAVSAYFNFLGNKATGNFDPKAFHSYYQYSVFAVFLSALNAALTSARGGFAGAISSGFINLCFGLYFLYFIWSFDVRLAVGDIETLRFGPRRWRMGAHQQYPNQHIAQGVIVQGQPVQNMQGQGQTPIYSANVGNQNPNMNAGYVNAGNNMGAVGGGYGANQGAGAYGNGGGNMGAVGGGYGVNQGAGAYGNGGNMGGYSGGNPGMGPGGMNNGYNSNMTTYSAYPNGNEANGKQYSGTSPIIKK